MAIKLTKITKKFDDEIVLENFSQGFKLGKTTCIMGPSGSGKTTLLRMMMGLVIPDEGLIEGVENFKKSVVFQEERLCENLTVMTNIRLVSQKSLEMTQITEALQQVDLPAVCLKQPIQQLSGGQKRRVAILRALLADYDILFMDEPFKGLDLETKRQVMAYVKEMTRGKTVILVTHDPLECEMMDSEVIYLP